MTMPNQYARASQDFDRFVEALRIRLDHTTRHQTYQTIESVLRVFRRRLTPQQVLDFANVLPAVLRAILLENWRLEEPQRAFTDMAAMNREVQEFRINHDLSPDDAIEAVAEILAQHVLDPVAFDRALDALPPEAQRFWGRQMA